MKVLYVSDSLGVPIEMRGIHNFSISLIENLKSQGATVDLLVERPLARWMPTLMKSKAVDIGVLRNSIALGELFRFLSRRNYSTHWIARHVEKRFVFSSFLKMKGWSYVAFARFWAGKTTKVDNEPELVDFIPANVPYVSLPAHFVITPWVYTEMVLRATWGLPPGTIDATGYDLVIFDTPMYFKIKGIDSGRIVSVVHDLIPLREAEATPFWRNLFFKKIEAMMALRPNFLFVSEFSRNVFKREFPKYNLRHSFVYYPSLRTGTLRRAEAAERRKALRFAPTGLSALEASVQSQDLQDKLNAPTDPMERQIAIRARYQRKAQLQDAYVRFGWNTSLPYFVTVVSDEVRKNIDLLLKAFTALRGRANMVVLGNVTGSRYVGDDPDRMGNIRFTGYIPENEKWRIIAAADGLIFPSFTEGFGIPITEGALLTKPVLCSDIEVFREVAGDEAYYFDPYKEDSLVAAVDAVIAWPELARQRAERLKARVLERFTVEATAIRVRAFLEEIGLKPEPVA